MSTNRKTLDAAKMNIAVKEAEFQVFIDEFKVQGAGDPFTHVSKDPSAKYYFDKATDDDGDDNLKRFYTKYEGLVNLGCRLGLAEKPEKFGPLRLDFDLKENVDCDTIERKYTPEMVESIVLKIQTAIATSVIPEEFEEKMATCLLLEKSKPRSDDGYIRDGFHLHFPHFICEAWFYDEFIRPMLTEHLLATSLFDKCGYTNTIEQIVDSNIMTKTWCMYGSTTKSKTKSFDLREPYLVTNVYKLIGAESEGIQQNYKTKGIDVSKDSDEYKSHLEKALNIVFDEEMGVKTKSIFVYLPELLSIRGYSEITPLRAQVSSRRRKTTVRRRNPVANRKRSNEDIMKDLTTIRDGKLMEMLSAERADGFNEWMDVGWTLYCIGEGCDEALDMWIDFSRQSASFNEGKCQEEWGKMELRGKSIKSLIAMARKDSPQEFREWRRQTINYYLYNSLLEEHPNEYDLSEVVKHLYSERFVCADSKKDKWYEFVGHRWREVDDGLSLKKLFCDDVRQLYYDLNCDIAEKLRNLKNDVDRDRAILESAKLEKQQKRCCSIATSLKTVSFHEKLMKMCKIQFHDPLFQDKLDANLQLFGCENGVLDLKGKIFREGRPDDYISLSCGLNYNPSYTTEDDDVQLVNDFIRKIFPDPDLKNYFLDATCACLEGGNTNKIFVVHTGEPDGGKSAMMDFVNRCFGQYYGTFPSEMFIKGPKVSSAQARPELVQAKGKRIMDTKEVSKGNEFDPMPLKLLTGNDMTFGRGLHSNGGVFKPQFTLWISCNEPPKIPAHDNALWTRGRFLPYESKFVKPRELKDYPVADTEEERTAMKRWVADPNIVEDLKECASAFLWILFERYHEYKLRGLKDPEKVITATQKIRYMNDIFIQFIKEKIEHVEESDPSYGTTFLKLADLSEEFTSWNKENNSYLKEKWSRVQLQHEFSKRFGVTTTKGRSVGWQGYRIYIETLDDDRMNDVHNALIKSK